MFKPSRIALAFVFALSLSACHRNNRCQSVCEQRQKELRCNPSESCKATCDELHEESPCSAAMRGWEACLVSLPVEQWECDVKGQPAPKNTACTDARANVIACISKYPQWPLPKK
jgi:hypothetical protein